MNKTFVEGLDDLVGERVFSREYDRMEVVEGESRGANPASYAKKTVVPDEGGKLDETGSFLDVPFEPE